MKGKKFLFSWLLAIIVLALVVGYLLYKESGLIGFTNPFDRTTSITENVVVSGALNNRAVVLNDRPALLSLIGELNIFEPNAVSLMGGDYTTGHTITKMVIVFSDQPRKHPLYGSVTGTIRSSMDTALSEDGTLTITIHIDTHQKTDQQISNHVHLALFTALYLVSNDIRLSGILNQATTFATEKGEPISNMPLENRMIILSKHTND